MAVIGTRGHRIGIGTLAGVLIALVTSLVGGAPIARAESVQSCDDDLRATAAGEAPAIVPVWALVDGDTPLVGARVRVYAVGENDGRQPGRRRLLRALSPIAEQRTYDTGLALLRFADLPQSFLVEVSGGRAEGRPVRGFLSAAVRGYAGEIVYVTPVSTLAERWTSAEPDLTPERAQADVQHALGIPPWADAEDLRATDRWFDGDTFLEDARNDFRRSIPRLLSLIRRGESMRVLPDGSAADVSADEAGSDTVAFASAPAGGGDEEEWWKRDLKQLLKDGFADLGLSVFRTGAEAGGKWLLGKLLDEWGLKSIKDFLLPPDSSEVMIKILGELQAKTTRLQQSVEGVKQALAETQYSVLVALTNEHLSAIDRHVAALESLATLPPGNTSRYCYAKKLDRDIEANLLAVPAELHRALDNPAPGANDILKAASQVYGARRFFTATSSANIQATYEYFALYQFRLAILLTNYWNAHPGTYDPELIVKPAIARIESSIAAQQKDRLKPALPADKFVDTRTMTMWDRTPPWVGGERYQPVQGRCHCSREWQYCDLDDPNWQARARDLGTEDDFKQLIEGWELGKKCVVNDPAGRPRPVDCRNPLDYLRSQVGFVTSAPSDVPAGFVGHVWIGPVPVAPVQFGFFGCGYNTITRINLFESDKPGPHVFYDYLYSQDPQFYPAHAMNRQAVAPGSYWWPLGGQ